MISKTVMSQQIDDADKAADEIVEALFRDFSPRKNSCGILFCDSDMDQAGLMKKLCPRLDFPIIGATTIAAFNDLEGLSDMCVTLTVLSGDSLEFAVGASEPITKDNVASAVSSALKKATAGYDEPPKFILAFPPFIPDTVLDEYTNAFNAALPGVPVVGGIPSFQGKGDVLRAICGTETYRDRMVFAAVYGDIRPLITVANVSGIVMKKKVVVTSAQKNVVYKVQSTEHSSDCERSKDREQTFVEYMKDMGFDFSYLSTDISVPFFSSPLIIEQFDEESGDTYTLVRGIHGIDMQNESCVSIGLVPEGSTLSLASLSRGDIGKSVSAAAEYIAGEIRKREAEDPSYRYSTALTVSCISRYFLMSPNHLNMEAEKILRALPPGLSLAGFYSYGEIGPLPRTAAPPKNFAHTVSFVLCVL